LPDVPAFNLEEFKTIVKETGFMNRIKFTAATKSSGGD